MNKVYTHPFYSNNMGNLMINIVTAMTFAKRNNMLFGGLVIDDLMWYDTPILKNIEKVILLDIDKPIYEGQFDESNVPTDRNIVLTSLKQDLDYIDKDIAFDLFGISDDIKNTIERLYGDLSDYIAVHIRRGDYIIKLANQYFNVLFKEDVEAIKLEFFKNEKKFIFISNDILFVKEIFGEGYMYADLPTENANIIDMYIMTLTKGVIMSNSTYSWWGAYLNTNPNKLIVCPYPWFKSKVWEKNDNFIPHNWFIWNRPQLVDVCLYYNGFGDIVNVCKYYIEQYHANVVHLYNTSDCDLCKDAYINKMTYYGRIDYYDEYAKEKNAVYESFYNSFKYSFDYCIFTCSDDFKMPLSYTIPDKDITIVNKDVFILKHSLLDVSFKDIVPKVDLLCIGCYNLEHNYIEEYCRYYIERVGIDTIHLLDDIVDNEHTLDEIPYISKMIDCHKIRYTQVLHTKEFTQAMIYTDYHNKHYNEYDWLCVFDCDEFISTELDIHAYLGNGMFNDVNVIIVPWIMYSTNGYIERPNDENILLYINDDNTVDDYILFKDIIRGGKKYNRIWQHAVFDDNERYAALPNGEIVEYGRDNLYFIFSLEMYTKCHLKHIYTRSVKLFLDRRMGFDLNIGTKRYEKVIDTLYRVLSWSELVDIVCKGFKNNITKEWYEG